MASSYSAFLSGLPCLVRPTNKKRHHQTTASRAIVQSCLHLQRCVATVRIVSISCAVVCCSSGQSASTRSAMHLPCVCTFASLWGFLCQPIFLIQTAPLQTRDSVHSCPAHVKRFRSSKSHRI